MIKKFIISTLYLTFCLIGFSLNAEEILPELKPTAMVDDTVVTFGDLFTDLKEKHDIVVANAPEPGKKIIISARHILKLSRDHNVRWRNSSAVKNVSITRLSTVITVAELSGLISDELKNLYQSEQNFDIRYYNRNVKIHLPSGYDVQDLSIKNIALDKKSDKFSAIIGAPTGFGSETLITVNGRTLKVAQVPTLIKTIRKGEVIQASHIEWISIPEAQVSRNMILDMDRLVGMTPRTQIKEGATIRLSEVNRPILVKRGSLVQISFNTSRISLSTIGKAIDNGGKGDVIKVKNNSSDKIITAVVLGENQVQVSAGIGNFVLLNN